MFGIWKRRFPVLSLGIRLKFDKVEGIIVATAVLHNIAQSMNDGIPPVGDDLEAAVQFVNNVNVYPPQRQNNPININNTTRAMSINEYFQQLL